MGSNNGDRDYPWGDMPEASCANTVMDDANAGGDGCGRGSSWPICQKRSGDSISGLCDFAGSIREWSSTTVMNNRIICGGSWEMHEQVYMRASGRAGYSATRVVNDFGMRCVRSADATATNVWESCSEILNAGASRGDGVYWIDPDGPQGIQAFPVYCDMTTAGGGWAVFMVASTDVAQPNTTATIIDPDAPGHYSYMSHAEFAAVAQVGDQVRAWSPEDTSLWMECDFEFPGTNYKNWQANVNCEQRVALVAGGYQTMTLGSVGNGFIHRSEYDAINPANVIIDHSVFTKANQPGCCASDPPKWAVPGPRVNGAVTRFYGTWVNDYDRRLIYAIRKP